MRWRKRPDRSERELGVATRRRRKASRLDETLIDRSQAGRDSLGTPGREREKPGILSRSSVSRATAQRRRGIPTPPSTRSAHPTYARPAAGIGCPTPRSRPHCAGRAILPESRARQGVRPDLACIRVVCCEQPIRAHRGRGQVIDATICSGARRRGRAYACRMAWRRLIIGPPEACSKLLRLCPTRASWTKGNRRRP